MTDEERAEKYAIENWEYYEEGQTDYKALKQAFLEGLQAGRPRWHKVADGDLPKVNKLYLVCLDWTGRKSEILNKQEIEVCKNVIAWCEIPKFKEE